MEHNKVNDMWDLINDAFGKYPSQMKIIKHMMNYGFSVNEKFDGEYSLYSGKVEVRPSSLAEAINVDKRVVIQVIKKIREDPKLFEFFKKLKPTADLSSASSKLLDLGIMEIKVEDPNKPGVIRDIINVISSRNIGIRQVMVSDPELSDEPLARIVTEKNIDSDVVTEIKKISGVTSVTIL
jgi:predicted regulator of amino acid metabolism with ACT domain